MLYGGGEEARSTSAEWWISRDEPVCWYSNAILTLVSEVYNSLSCPEISLEHHQGRIAIEIFTVSLRYLSDFSGLSLFGKWAAIAPALSAQRIIDVD